MRQDVSEKDHHSRTVCEKFHLSVEIYLAVLWKLYSTCPREYFGERHFILKKEHFSISFGHWAKIFGLFVKNYKAGLLKHHFTCPYENFEASFFRKKSHQSRTICEKFQFSVEIVFGRIVKTLFNVSTGIFWGKKFFLKKNILYQFRTLGENYWAVCRKIYGGVVKNSFHLSKVTFWEWIFLVKKKQTLSFLDNGLKLFYHSIEQNLPPLSKLHLPCPIEHFVGKQFYRINLIFSLQISDIQQKISAFNRKFFGCLVKTAL